MTLLQLTATAIAGVTLAATASAPDAPRGPVTPASTAVVIQAPAACSPTPTTAELPAAALRLRAAGADVSVVCDAASATAAVVRAAAGHAAVLGEGPDVRAALSLAAADHPTQRFGPLPAR